MTEYTCCCEIIPGISIHAEVIDGRHQRKPDVLSHPDTRHCCVQVQKVGGLGTVILQAVSLQIIHTYLPLVSDFVGRCEFPCKESSHLGDLSRGPLFFDGSGLKVHGWVEPGSQPELRGLQRMVSEPEQDAAFLPIGSEADVRVNAEPFPTP